MIPKAPERYLFFYQCSNCGTVLSASVKAPHDDHYRCGMCYRWMRFIYSTPVETPDQQDLHRLGKVFNPGFAPRCDECHKYRSAFSSVTREGLGTFCSQACAEKAAARHDAVLSRSRVVNE